MRKDRFWTRNFGDGALMGLCSYRGLCYARDTPNMKKYPIPLCYSCGISLTKEQIAKHDGSPQGFCSHHSGSRKQRAPYIISGTCRVCFFLNQMDVNDAVKGHRMTTLATMLEKHCQDITLQSWKDNEMRCLRCRAPMLTDHAATFGDTDGSYDRNKWLVENCFKDNAGVNLLVNCGYKDFLNFFNELKSHADFRVFQEMHLDPAGARSCAVGGNDDTVAAPRTMP